MPDTVDRSGAPAPDASIRSSDPSLIHARGLTKRFGDFTAVDAIDFDVAPGESFGFLGPNGAGKTSTMRMIGCVSPMTGGHADGPGHGPDDRRPADPRAARRRAPAGHARHRADRPREPARSTAATSASTGRRSAERADELLEFAQLTERANDQVEPLSGGMKRRLTIARALINEPTLLLLDEPTTGLDPQARHLLWDRLYRLKQRGVTLVLTTHYMDEAEQLCDRLVVMDKAKIVAEGSPRSLIEQYSTREVTELRFAPGVAETLDGQLDGIAERIEHLPDRVLLYADDGEAAVGRRPRARPPARGGPRPPVVARGRLPAPDRPLADRVGGRPMTAAARPTSRPSAASVRVFEHRLLSVPADVPRERSSARSCRRSCS